MCRIDSRTLPPNTIKVDALTKHPKRLKKTQTRRMFDGFLSVGVLQQAPCKTVVKYNRKNKIKGKCEKSKKPLKYKEMGCDKRHRIYFYLSCKFDTFFI